MELQIINNLQRWSALEPWKQELAKMVIQAEKENKLMLCKYQQLVFEPKRLMQELMNGRFIWGVINWSIISRSNDIKIDWPYHVEAIRNAQKKTS